MVDGRDRSWVRELGNECLSFVTQSYIGKDNGAAGIEKLLCEC